MARVAPRLRAADAIVEDLRAQIASGAIGHGERLPPERTLAARYGVSGPTVREALQGLSAMGLLEMRHGSGSYVCAVADALVARSLGTVLQLEAVSVQDVLGLLGALNVYAARLAVDRATGADIAGLEAAISGLDAARDVDAIVGSLRDFAEGLARSAHDPLLGAITAFLLDVQLAVALELSSRSYATWYGVSTLLQPDRLAIVDALKRRDRAAVPERVAEFHARALELIDAHGVVGRISLSDERLTGVVSGIALGKGRSP